MPAVLSLALENVRNHAETRLAPGAAPAVLLSGPNGAGKTAILEALSLLAVGKGLRGGPLSAIARAPGPGGFRLRAHLLAEPDLPAITLETGARTPSPERRFLLVNDAAEPLARLSDWLSLLWLTPAMDRLFADTAGARRRFLDRLVLALDPAHARNATRYEAAMRERTRLLTGDTPPDPAWIDALEAAMDLHGGALAEARADTVDRLSRELLASAPDGFPRPLLSPMPRHPRLAAALAASRQADRAAGRAGTGPHRDDLVVHLASGTPASSASTGEQKALLVSLLLAHAAIVSAARGRPPLVLLDEAAAHLDPERRRALFRHLLALGGQVWLTGTEPALFDGLDGARFTVESGTVRPIHADFHGTFPAPPV
jgi:DNA replication and repair protein RecF